MDSISKILLFFIICIIAGLGIGIGISKIKESKTAQVVSIVNVVPQVAPVVVSESPPSVGGVSRGSASDGVVVSTNVKPTPKPYACPVAPVGEPDEWLAPMGPDFGVDNNYIPANLIILDKYVSTTSDTMCLAQSAALALQSMNTAMKSQGLYIVITSAYRPASYQENLHETSESNRNPVTNPYPLVALAGHSEHQLGMAVDIVAGSKYNLDDFINTPEYTWLIAHSWEYGFIQSYPIGSESITGYSTES